MGCGVEISDLPCLVSGHNLDLTSEDMADIHHQGIAVGDSKNPVPETIHVPEKITYHNWKKRIIEDLKEFFDRGDQTIYTTPMLISMIILVRR